MREVIPGLLRVRTILGFTQYIHSPAAHGGRPLSMLRSGVGMTHVLEKGLVMVYAGRKHSLVASYFHWVTTTAHGVAILTELHVIYMERSASQICCRAMLQPGPYTSKHNALVFQRALTLEQPG